MVLEAYHDATVTQHNTYLAKYFAQGLRIISLSVYGDPGNERYAAVWVQREGPPWVEFHGVNSAGYQTVLNEETAKGYVPVLVSATGTSNNARFAVVFEQNQLNNWNERHDIDEGTFQNLNRAALDQKLILRSVAIYGTASDRRYAAVWYPNPEFVKCHVHPSDTSASLPVDSTAETLLPGYRLAGYRVAYVALAADHIYCPVFKDDVVGPWVWWYGMTSADYQAEFDRQTALGFYPICVQGGGSGNHTRFAAIFAKQDIPLTRQWTVMGTAISATTEFDYAMKTFMQANGVRAAQLAVAKNGVTQFSHAYTWAEDGYRITQPSDRFLLASCSKMFLEAAVQALYDSKKLSPNTKVYPLLGFAKPADTRSDTITIQQLLDHTGGYDETGTGFDPTGQMREIALELYPYPSIPVAVTRLDVARYMYERKCLAFDPGTATHYSNFGYLLAAAVVERVTGIPYFDYLKTTLLQPAGITEVEVFPTLASQRTNNMAIIEDEELGLSALDPGSPLFVPAVYGSGSINEVNEADGSLGGSAHALTQFIHLHAVSSNGPRVAGLTYARAGSGPGASTLAESRADGIDWAYVINTRDWLSCPSLTLDNLGNWIRHLIDTAKYP